MGGTTAKICLIEKYQPETARVFEVDRAARFLKGSGLPVRIPVIEMVEIGAGGGSIAHVDALKRVTVGPESAGVRAGPGLLRPRRHAADRDRCRCRARHDRSGCLRGRHDHARSGLLAQAALATAVGEPLGLSPETAAYAVHEMVCENMASAARVHAVERGEVVSDHTLIAFGGAAPLHAARVAEKLGVARVIVPPNAGVGSAVGFLAAPIAYELVRSRHMRLDNFDFAGASDAARRDGDAMRARWSSRARAARRSPSGALAYMRYVGQGHEITVAAADRAT